MIEMIKIGGWILAIFVAIIALPMLRILYYNRKAVNVEITEYDYPSQLIDKDLSNIPYEVFRKDKEYRMGFRSNGSIRIAQGAILPDDEFDSRKAVAYSKELP